MILLIGNFLSTHGLNPTAIEDLAVSLSTRYKIRTASCKKNPIIRLSDMVIAVLASRKVCKLIIVDVFSQLHFVDCVKFSLFDFFLNAFRFILKPPQSPDPVFNNTDPRM